MPARALTTFGIAGVLSAAALLAAQTPAPPAAQTPAPAPSQGSGQGSAQTPFRGGIDLVSLNVTVTDGNRFVTDLEQGDIEIFEDGVKQDTTFFSKVQQPI